MFHAFTRVPGESYRRRLRSLSLFLCCIFVLLINSLVCWKSTKRQHLWHTVVEKTRTKRQHLWHTAVEKTRTKRQHLWHTVVEKTRTKRQHLCHTVVEKTRTKRQHLWHITVMNILRRTIMTYNCRKRTHETSIVENCGYATWENTLKKWTETIQYELNTSIFYLHLFAQKHLKQSWLLALWNKIQTHKMFSLLFPGVSGTGCLFLIHS